MTSLKVETIHVSFTPQSHLSLVKVVKNDRPMTNRYNKDLGDI